MSTRTLKSPSIQSTVPAESKEIVHSPSFCTGASPSGSQTLNFQPAVDLQEPDDGSRSASEGTPGIWPAKRRQISCFTVSRSGHCSAGRSNRGRMRLPFWRMLRRRDMGVWDDEVVALAFVVFAPPANGPNGWCGWSGGGREVAWSWGA